jgi:hypothetical protein
VPVEPLQPESKALVRVSDAGGRKAFHAFKVLLRADAPPPDKGPEPLPDKDLPPPNAAARRTAGIKAPILDGDKVVKLLPGPISDVAVGGGGRYLILHVPKQGKLLVFDVNQVKVVHEIPVGKDLVNFAGGMDKLIVVQSSDSVQRWDLTTFKKELDAPLLLNGVIKALSMGAASDGPMLVNWSVGTKELDRATFSFLDPRTMKFLRLKQNPRIGMFSAYRDRVHVRASADGKVFGLWCTGVSPSGLGTMVFTGTEARTYYDHTSVGQVVPGPDGKVVHTGSGLHTEQGKVLGTDRRELRLSFPAHHGPFYLGQPPGGKNQPLSLYVVGDARKLADVPALDVFAEKEEGLRNDFTLDKRVHFLPDAKLILTIPGSKDRLVLQRFDVDEALQKSALDYLFVTSQPPRVANKGTAYVYQLEVKSKKGGVQYRLESGPKGMGITKGGLLWWRVPADAAAADVPVIISIRDGSGQELFHTLSLALN